MNDSAKKKVIHEYLSQGKRQEAIIYIQEAYSVSYLESHKLLSAIEAEGTYQSSASQTTQSSSSGYGCGGCLNAAFKIFSVFFMFISISLLGMFGAIYYFTQQEKQDLVDVKAIIVDLLEVSSGKVQPVVEYTWGEEVLIDTIDFAVDSGEFEFGEVIDVLIHPDYPDDVILEKSLTADLFDIQGTNDDVSELQWMEFIQNGFIYVLLVPGLLLFVFSIFLWWLGGKVGGK